MSASAIDTYLEQLERELRLKRTPRRRLLTETADHLRSSAADIASAGVSAEEAERTAVARFGAAALVARRFAHAAASTSARTALVWVATAFVTYAGVAVVFMLTAPSWLLDFPQGAPTMLGLQVALVALALSAVRTVRFRNTLVIDEPRLRLVANGILIAAVALAAAAGAELLLALTRPAAAQWSDATTLIAVYTVAVSAVGAAALVAIATGARASAVDVLPRRRGDDVSPAAASLVDDVAAFAEPLTPAAAFVATHPASTCALVAGFAFAAVTATGLETWPPSLVAGAAAAGAFEAAAVVAAYLTLGRALGLRPPESRRA